MKGEVWCWNFCLVDFNDRVLNEYATQRPQNLLGFALNFWREHFAELNVLTEPSGAWLWMIVKIYLGLHSIFEGNILLNWMFWQNPVVHGFEWQSIHMNSDSVYLTAPHVKREMNLTLNLLDDARGVLMSLLIVEHLLWAPSQMSYLGPITCSNSVKVTGQGCIGEILCAHNCLLKMLLQCHLMTEWCCKPAFRTATPPPDELSLPNNSSQICEGDRAKGFMRKLLIPHSHLFVLASRNVNFRLWGEYVLSCSRLILP
jgi:hypothetical protein